MYDGTHKTVGPHTIVIILFCFWYTSRAHLHILFPLVRITSVMNKPMIRFRFYIISCRLEISTNSVLYTRVGYRNAWVVYK